MWPCQQRQCQISQSWRTAHCTLHIFMVLVSWNFFWKLVGAVRQYNTFTYHVQMSSCCMLLLNQLEYITAHDRPLFLGSSDFAHLYNQNRITSRQKKNLIGWLSCNKNPCRTFPFLLSTQSDTTVWNATGDKKKSLSCMDWPPECHRTEKTLILAQSLRTFSITSGDLSCTFLSVLAFLFGPSTTLHLLIALFWGPKAVFGFGTAACTWCSGPEVIMWVTSQLRLEGTQEWKQTEGSLTISSHKFVSCLCDTCNSAAFMTKQKTTSKTTEVTGWPDGEGELSSPVVTNWRSDPKAAMELLGRMQRSPEKLLRSNA